MNWLLDFYVVYEDWINFAKDLAFFVGFFAVLKFLWNFTFERKSKAIKENLKSREKMEADLRAYILDKPKGTKEIAIRFVHWKNYPANLSNDGFLHFLHIRYQDQFLQHRWIDNTGIKFEEKIWFFSNSVYVDKNGISFMGPEGGDTLASKKLPTS